MTKKTDPQPTCDVICLGMLVADLFASPLNSLPKEGELIRVDDLLLQTGGCAANTGVDLVKLGVTVSIAGMVGDDVFANFIISDLRKRGLDVSLIGTSQSRPTSRTVILPVINEDRRYIHMIGANAELSTQQIDFDSILKCRALYVGGYLILPALTSRSLSQLFKFAQEHGVLTILDVIVSNPNEGLDSIKEVLEYTDVFLPNDDEAKRITVESDPFQQIKVFSKCGVKITVITMGEKGAIVSGNGKILKIGTYKVPVVDPSGAGDAFDAGFIYGLLKNWDLRKILQFSSAVGASACTSLGCTNGVFSEKETLDFIKNNHVEIKEIFQGE